MVSGPPYAGHVIAGRFQLVTLLGRGGMGTVWRAHHLALDCPIAIKLIDPSIAAQPDAAARFVREARAAAALRSPNVVQILDFGVDANVPYIAMELLEGETLAHMLARERVLSPAQTLHIVRQIARAIAKAHEAGVVHRDLKPDNVFLTRHEDDLLVKVLDFGIAKVTGALGEGTVADTASTRTGSIVGSPCYMSPEQAWGKKTIDWRTDIYSLGVIAFECLLGRHPFTSEAVGELIVKICTFPLPVPSKIAPVPRAFDAWFAKAAHRDPGRRFQSAKELSTALHRAFAAEVPRLEPDSWIEGPPPFPPPPPVVEMPLARVPTMQASTVSVRLSRTPRRAAGIAAAFVTTIAFGTLVGWGIVAVRKPKPSAPTAQPSVADAPAPLGTTSAATETVPAPPPGTTAPAEPGADAAPGNAKRPAEPTQDPSSADAPAPSASARAAPGATSRRRPVSKVLGL